MANMIVPQDAEINYLELLISSILSIANMHLLSALPVGGVTPTTTLAQLLAVEATFTGYAPVQLTTWTTAVIDGSGAASSTSSNGIFSNTGGAPTSVFGMFLTDSVTTHAYGAEDYGGAISIPAG